MKPSSVLTIVLFLFSIFGTNKTFSQEFSCGTHFGDEEILHLKTVIKSLKVPQQKNDGLTCVPIRYHVVRSDEGFTSVTEESVLHSLTMMNRQFFDAGLSFYLIEPPVFYDDSDYLALSDNVTSDDVRALFDTPQNAVQFYILDDLNGPGGFAYYPSPTIVSNAIFVLSNAVAGSLGGTIPHELGHYFSLPHTFEGTENGNTDANAENVARTGADSNCETAGDSFCDTEADPGNNGFVNNCIYVGTEMDITNVIYDPPLDNPMSYHPPQCKSFMTAEQYEAIEQGYIFRQNQTAYHLDGPGLDVLAPTALTYSIDGGNNIVLTFNDNADNEYGYLLEMSQEGSDNLMSVPLAYAVENETEIIITNYDETQSYWFRVRPATGDCSTYSNTLFIPAGFNLDTDGSSGAAQPNFNAGALCGNGELPLSDSDLQLLGSVNGVQINVQLNGVLDGDGEFLIADTQEELEISGIGTTAITAINSNNLPLIDILNWISSIRYVHDGVMINRGTRTAGFWISSQGVAGDVATASFMVDRVYEAGPGGILTACPQGIAAWSNLLPENADEGTWYTSSGEELSGAFDFSLLNDTYTYIAGAPSCRVEAQYTITEVSPPDFYVFVENPKCETQCTGSVETVYNSGFIPFLDGIPFESKIEDLCDGVFNFTITNETGCNRTRTLDLTYQQNVSVKVPEFICTGDVVRLADVISLPPKTSAKLNGALISLYSPVFIAPSTTNLLELYNYEGCIDRSIPFSSLNCPTAENTPFFIPNAFSPDGDGLNDLFKPVCAFDLEFYQLLVFDRSGQLLFETDDIALGWNGAGKSDLSYFVPTTQFNYRIKYRLIGELEYSEIRGSGIALR
ncbi:MAG: gliding motility-associated C-terminal domain-containing protein [Cryomorphaceae bacterium]